MKHSPLLPLALTTLVMLTACNKPGVVSLDMENANPLVASRYGDELADTMANLVIQDDPVIKEPGMRAIIDNEIERGKKLSTDARDVQDKGMKGDIFQMKEEVSGHVLYVNDMVYLNTEFVTSPGPDLHVYLSTIVDPRDVTFPDPTAFDLGTIQRAYGAQAYAVPHQNNPQLYRMFVVWDKKLHRLYGFAQLSK